MNSPEFKNIACRICLDENVAFDWNNRLIEYSDVSYRDCYYKYTQLEQLDDDPLSSMLCENCSNGLEDVHSLIMKALDSYNFLLECNCGKIITEDSIIEEDNENCVSTDFETVLLEKTEPESAMLQQFECESFDEYSIKSEDGDLNAFEDTNDTQYQEMLEIEKQEEYDANECIENVKENMSNFYETRRKLNIISCKTKFDQDVSPNTKIDLKNSRASYSRHKSGRQNMDMESKYENFDDEASVNSDGERVNNYINTEDLQYEVIEEYKEKHSGGHKEYEEIYKTDHERTEEEVSTVYKAKRKNSEGAMSSKRSLEEDTDLNIENSLKQFVKLNTRQKNDANFKQGNKSKGQRAKNSGGIKRSKIKTKKHNHQNSQNTPRMCSYCSKILHNKYALQKHEKTHLANRERKAPCPICGVKFLEESYVKIHMQIHNQDRVKKHKCEFCDKAFYEKGSLNVHRRIHLGQMIPCTLCSKEFFRQVDLDIHMNSHSAAVINAETKKRSRYWVRCKYCNKDIMSTSFKYHTAVHLNEPQMKCSICDREFFRRDSCTDHLKTIHKITTEGYSNFIVLYNKNRLSHLYLEQTAELKK